MNFIHLMMYSARSLSICLACGLSLLTSSPLFSQTIRVDTTHPVQPIIPTEAVGARIDHLPTASTDKHFTEATIKQVLAAEWQPASYRQNTDVFDDASQWK